MYWLKVHDIHHLRQIWIDNFSCWKTCFWFLCLIFSSYTFTWISVKDLLCSVSCALTILEIFTIDCFFSTLHFSRRITQDSMGHLSMNPQDSNYLILFLRTEKQIIYKYINNVYKDYFVYFAVYNVIYFCMYINII